VPRLLKKELEGRARARNEVPQKLPEDLAAGNCPLDRSHRVQRRCAYLCLKILGGGSSDEKKNSTSILAEPSANLRLLFASHRFFVNERERGRARIALKDFLLWPNPPES